MKNANLATLSYESGNPVLIPFQYNSVWLLLLQNISITIRIMFKCQFNPKLRRKNRENANLATLLCISGNAFSRPVVIGSKWLHVLENKVISRKIIFVHDLYFKLYWKQVKNVKLATLWHWSGNPVVSCSQKCVHSITPSLKTWVYVPKACF